MNDRPGFNPQGIMHGPHKTVDAAKALGHEITLPMARAERESQAKAGSTVQFMGKLITEAVRNGNGNPVLDAAEDLRAAYYQNDMNLAALRDATPELRPARRREARHLLEVRPYSIQDSYRARINEAAAATPAPVLSPTPALTKQKSTDKVKV